MVNCTSIGVAYNNVSCHRSESWKSKIKVPTGFVPSKAGRENLFQVSLLLPVASGIPGLVMSFSLCLHFVFPLCVSVSVSTAPAFIRTPVVGLGPTPWTLSYFDPLQRPLSKYGCIQRSWGLGLHPLFWGGGTQLNLLIVNFLLLQDGSGFLPLGAWFSHGCGEMVAKQSLH